MNKEDVIKELVFHQAVIERVMKRFTILPVKFGTIVETEDVVRELLEHGYPLLSSELSKEEGKIELDVVAWWEIPKMLAFLSTRNEEIRGLQQKVATGIAHVAVEDKISLGRAIEKALQHEKTRYQQFLLNQLEQEAIDVSIHDPANDEMILNTAFLLEKANEECFNAALQTADQQLESLINFRAVGRFLPIVSRLFSKNR